MFIKLYESTLFFKYFDVKLHINTPYFGETLERTGQTGPQQREMRKAFRLAKQVEVGSQQIGFRKESHRSKQVGVAEAVP